MSYTRGRPAPPRPERRSRLRHAAEFSASFRPYAYPSQRRCRRQYKRHLIAIFGMAGVGTVIPVLSRGALRDSGPVRAAPRRPRLVTSVLIFASLVAIVGRCCTARRARNGKRNCAPPTSRGELEFRSFKWPVPAHLPSRPRPAPSPAPRARLPGLSRWPTRQARPAQNRARHSIVERQSPLRRRRLDVSLDSETLYENGDAVEHLEYRVKSMEATLTRFGIDVRSPDRRENVETP